MTEPGWSYVKGTPSKIVQGWGCHFGGFGEVSRTSVDRLEVPAASTVIVVCCGTPVTLQPALKPGSESRLVAFSAGLQVHAQRVTHSGVNDCVEIRLPPLAAYALFGGVTAESSHAPVDLLEVARESTTMLVEQLQSTTLWQDRLTAVDRFLSRGFMESKHRVPPELSWAWKILERSLGQISIRTIAQAVGWSERHLINQFCAYFGSRPKAVARRLRFSRACDLVTSGSTEDLCAIAAQAGFSDQSHMTREFRVFSGLTPSVLRTARFAELPGIPAAALLTQ